MSGYQGPTLRQMEYVLAVARTGKFGEAARECGVSQPALSKQIQEAEAIAGGPLFERARPRALLTARGEIFVKRARRALDEANMLFEAVHGCDRELGGELHLGVIPTIAPYLLPGLLGELREAYPSLIVVLHEAYTDEILAALGDGDLDLVLLAMPIEEQRLVGEDLYNEPFALLAPTGHRLAGDDRVCASELRDASLLLMEEGHCFRDQALEVCALAGASAPRSGRRASPRWCAWSRRGWGRRWCRCSRFGRRRRASPASTSASFERTRSSRAVSGCVGAIAIPAMTRSAPSQGSSESMLVTCRSDPSNRDSRTRWD